jgi:myo-inositol-1(or 4)-monophosphatase
LEHFQHTGPLQFKYAKETVTEADRQIEKFLSARIRQEFRDDAIFGEEFGPNKEEARPESELPPGRVWHIDPIDGTLNFALGLPNFCTSLALMDGNEILNACVYSPLRREGFTASRGEGARLNGQAMQVSERGTLSEAVLSAQLQKNGRYVQNAELLRALLLEFMKMRRLGTIALEMAYLADGRYDAMIAGRGRPQQLYDVAAGILLVQEAGGQVSNHRGEVYLPYSTDLVASNGQVHAELISLIEKFDPPNG